MQNLLNLIFQNKFLKNLQNNVHKARHTNTTLCSNCTHIDITVQL